MEDLIRQLYFGQYHAAAEKRTAESHYQDAYGKASEISQKIVDELKSKGVEEAEEMAEEWLNGWFTFTAEELAESFKKGVRFGVEFCKEVNEL